MHPQPCVRILVVSMHTGIHSGGTGNIRHSPRNGFTGYSALFPGTTALLTPSSRDALASCELDACFGAPEPHSFAVRNRKALVSRSVAATASHLTLLTIAKRPSCGGGIAGAKHKFLKTGNKIFLRGGLDRPSSLKGLGKLNLKISALRRPGRLRVGPDAGETARRANRKKRDRSLSTPHGEEARVRTICGQRRAWRAVSNHAGPSVASILRDASLARRSSG